MNNTKGKILIKIPEDIINEIAKLNNVDKKFIDRTIIRILKDEIELEKKVRSFQEKKKS